MLRRMMMAGGASIYLDDLAVTPRAVLSLRKLIRTATTAIRVRRSSDSAELDIGFAGAALDTAALAAFAGAGSAFVTTFYDQTGNGENLAQATSTKQPPIVNAGAYLGEAAFDGAAHAMAITGLTMGAAQVGIYTKMRQSSRTGVEIIAELSANYNVNAQSFVLYSDNTGGVARLWAASRNSTASSDYRLCSFSDIAFADITRQITVLFDRSIVGAGEIAAWQGGALAGPTAGLGTAEQTGVYSSYDLHVGSRAGSSLFRPMGLDTMVIYNADSAPQRANIEAIVA